MRAHFNPLSSAVKLHAYESTVQLATSHASLCDAVRVHAADAHNHALTLDVAFGVHLVLAAGGVPWKKMKRKPPDFCPDWKEDAKQNNNNLTSDK